MKIWIVTTGEPLKYFEPGSRPWRSQLLADALVAGGHTVTWWTSSFDHSHKRHYVNAEHDFSLNGVDFRVLHGRHYGRNVSLSRIINHVQVARRFRQRAAHEKRPDLIFCSYPTIELSAVATTLGAHQRVPVVLDIRDLWPDLFLDVAPTALRPVARVALHPWFSAGSAALSRADALVGISDAYLAWALKRARRERGSADQVFALGYQRQRVREPERQKVLAELVERGVDMRKTICWFVGTLGRSYDVRTVIRAARQMEEWAPDRCQFVISGSGDEESALRAEAQGLRSVLFTGWLGQSHLQAIGSVATVGLQPYRNEALQGLPNKLFEYLSFGLPVVSSLPGECSVLLAAEGIGFNYRAGDPEALATCLRRVLQDSSELKRAGRRAAQVFRDRFDAALIYPRLAAHLERLAAGHPAPANPSDG